MNQELDSIAAVLRKAYQVEVDGFTFYSMAAERAAKPATQKLFARLAQGEVGNDELVESELGVAAEFVDELVDRSGNRSATHVARENLVDGSGVVGHVNEGLNRRRHIARISAY